MHVPDISMQAPVNDSDSPSLSRNHARRLPQPPGPLFPRRHLRSSPRPSNRHEHAILPHLHRLHRPWFKIEIGEPFDQARCDAAHDGIKDTLGFDMWDCRARHECTSICYFENGWLILMI